MSTTLRSPLAYGTLLSFAVLILSACSASTEPSAGSSKAPPSSAPPQSSAPEPSPAPVTELANAPASPAKNAVPRCHVADLRASNYDPYTGKGTMGKDGVIVKLTNSSDHTCTIEGYGGYGLLDAQGHPIPTKIIRGPTWLAPDPGRHPITLRKGESAYSALDWGIMGPDGDGTCDKFSPTLQITPPDERDFLTAPLAGVVCRGDAVENIHGTAYAAQPPAY